MVRCLDVEVRLIQLSLATARVIGRCSVDKGAVFIRNTLMDNEQSETNSDHASVPSGSHLGTSGTLISLSARIKKLLTTSVGTPIPASRHRSAAETMVHLRDSLLTAHMVPSEVGVHLACVGVSLERRVALCTESMTVDEEAATTTMALIFGLLVMCKLGCPGDAGGEDFSVVIAAWNASSIDQELRSASGTGTDSWSLSVRSPESLCLACVSDVATQREGMSLQRLIETARIFFRSTSKAMVAQLLNDAGCVVDGNPFTSLESVSVIGTAPSSIEARLLSIVDCAESEAGQTILRDLILSFKLPRSIVGIRSLCLLSRAANKSAASSHATELSEAHDAALRGARWTFLHDLDDTHKACAVLAGIAVMLFVDSQSLRRDDMFYGTISLPFLETAPPSKTSTPRLTLLAHTGEWVLYCISSTGGLEVQLRQCGIEGLSQAALALTGTHNPPH